MTAPQDAKAPVETEKVRISLEFFPPRSPAGAETLRHSIERLAPMSPDFVSVTYGAGGSTQAETLAALRGIVKETSLAPAGHLTCVGATRDQVDAIIRAYADDGVRHIVALRGDPREGIGTRYRPRADGYENAAALVAGIRRIGNFEISVSAYPERHPESRDWTQDIDMLKRKVDNGADRAITQFFFDNDLYEAYLERVRQAGIEIPIVPGLMPIRNFENMVVFATKCGASVPDRLTRRFAGLDRDADTRKLIATTVLAEQVADLQSRGVSQFHFYTMNRADIIYAICHLLGRRPGSNSRQAA
jgi:methylenetetrahydrofolate reductase (NADPH)